MRFGLLSLIGFVCVSARVVSLPEARQDNDGIHLAVGVRCGALAGNTSDVNAGIRPDEIKIIVSFGVIFDFQFVFIDA